jgi:hypothetical protein
LKSRQQELKERSRLKSDLPFYAYNLLRIRTKSGKILPFNLNDAQYHLHEEIERQKIETSMVRALILKGRQQGCSTYVGARFYHLTTHHYGFRTFILTHEQEATTNLFDMVDRFHELMAPGYKPHIGASNRKELIFDELDSGYRVGTAGTKGVGRSATIQLFHGSEVAFWPHAETHAAGILQAVPKEEGTEVILESTANGLGNLYHQMWQQAVAGLSEYIPIFIPWYWQDEYSTKLPDDFELTEDEAKFKRLYDLSDEKILWRRKKIIELGDPLLFKQEYPSNPDEAFQTTGIESFISNESVIIARKQPQYKTKSAIVAGFDPAREGDDRDAFIYRQGLNAFGLEYKDFKTFPEKVAYCIGKLKDKKNYIQKLFIDYGGGGWEIAGLLREAGFGDRVKVVNFGAKAMKNDSYKNKRAEMYGELKKWLTDENETPSIPDDDALHADLTAAGYSYDTKTRLQLEKKKDIKKRSLLSPDGADALALTFAFPIGMLNRTQANPIPTKSFF